MYKNVPWILPGTDTEKSKYNSIALHYECLKKFHRFKRQEEIV
jgi:hypothetical protein